MMMELEVVSQGAPPARFRLSRDGAVRSVLESWAAGHGGADRAAANWRFLLDGELVGQDATPKLLGLEDGDRIDAFFEQEGGVTGSGSRVRMPHNNRVSSSVSLKTNDMWSKTIGYDPYAAGAGGGAADDGGDGAGSDAAQAESMERAKGIMALAKISSAEQGNSDRSTNFAKQVFWGLKRKAPPKGYELPVLSDVDDSDEESSSDDSSSDSDSDSDSGGEGRGGGGKRKTGEGDDGRKAKSSSSSSGGGGGKSDEEERRRKKEKKARKKTEKAERKKHKKEKKARKKAERKEKKRRRKERRAEENADGEDGGEKKKKKKKKSSH